jgi:TatD DNase family protein
LPEVVAVGEVGLDFHRNYSKQEIQIEAFEKQVSHQNIFILEMS